MQREDPSITGIFPSDTPENTRTASSNSVSPLPPYVRAVKRTSQNIWAAYVKFRIRASCGNIGFTRPVASWIRGFIYVMFSNDRRNSYLYFLIVSSNSCHTTMGAVEETIRGSLLRMKSSNDSIWCSTSRETPCVLKYDLIADHSIVFWLIHVLRKSNLDSFSKRR